MCLNLQKTKNIASNVIADATVKLNAKSFVLGLYLIAMTLTGDSPAPCTFKGNATKIWSGPYSTSSKFKFSRKYLLTSGFSII